MIPQRPIRILPTWLTVPKALYSYKITRHSVNVDWFKSFPPEDNLLPRVLRLLGQQVVAGRDWGKLFTGGYLAWLP